MLLEKKRTLSKKINFVVKVFSGLLLLIVNVTIILPGMRDLPYVIKNEYKTFEGYTTSRAVGKNSVNYHKRVFNRPDEPFERAEFCTDGKDRSHIRPNKAIS